VPTFAWLHALASTVDVRALFLGARDEWVWAKAAEEEEGLLLSPADALSHEDFLSHVKTAALLEDWVQETAMDAIEERYRVGPGDVRDKVDRGRWLAHAMRELARVLHFESATVLNDLPVRLESGVRAELLPMVRLEGVGRVRARRLYAAGFTGIAKLRKAKVEQLQRVETIGPKLARRILEQVTAGDDATDEDRRPERSLEAY
jgi:helicase